MNNSVTNMEIYVVYSGTAKENDASNTQFFKDISELFDMLEALKTSEDITLKTKGVKKYLRSATVLDSSLDEDTVYVELLNKDEVTSWYNINKFNLEVLIG